jgi:uncharacterized protein YjiS (DUF1127 family)
MPNEYALIGLVHLVARDKRMTHADGVPLLLAAEHTDARRTRARVLRVVARRAARRIARLLRLRRRRMAESDELRAMSDRELRDFGISRYDVEHEAKKAFWRAYREHW